MDTVLYRGEDACMTSRGPLPRQDHLSFTAGFAIGLLAGAACALLFAPAPGAATRGRIRAQATTARAEVARLFRERNSLARSLIRRYGVLGLWQGQRSTQQTPTPP